MPRCRDTAIFVVTTDKPITLHARGVISRDGRAKKYTNKSIVGIITDEIHLVCVLFGPAIPTYFLYLYNIYTV